MDFGSPRLPGEIGVHVDAGPSSPRPKRRRLRIAACFFALVVAACVITGALLYRQRSAPERIRLLAERELGRFFQTDVRVESAHYSWSEGVSLFGVTVAEPDSQGAGVDRPARHRPAAVLSCPEIRVQLNVWLTLFGRPAIQNVVLLGPTFAIARDAQTGASNLCGLIQDIEEWLEKLAPVNPAYNHHKTGEDNGDAHLKRILINHQVIVPVTDGKLDLGPWEQIFYAEFDGKRKKRVILKALGI